MKLEIIYKKHLSLLTSIAYRMLGSLADAEDIVQEVFLEVQKLDTDHVYNMKAYLVKSVTNRCINFLKSARKRREVYVGPWLPEPQITLSEQNPMELVVKDEAISYAFLVMLNQLNAVERAVFILREVLDYSYSEIAQALDKTEENCRKIYSRIKKKLHQDVPVPSSNMEKEDALVQSFILASKTGNFDNFISMLTDDAILTMDGGGKVRGALRPIISRHRILALFKGIVPRGYFEGNLLPVHINNQRGILLMRNDQPTLVICFGWDLRQEHIKRIFIISNPDKLKHIQV
ncbi:RNA polymerase sigma-70 factor [Aneurinibacillus migulanus]|uniref:RNA polymerase sigma-70 factor n=1 Tax=Aneurinibacillus migulanus TaxID=47500 RepID=UPI00209C8F00|nr:RNA polymerase sigma-70 factor [Aneurinibacillus migulanus]MCP1356208.1 RNA polymerase sigma-70 factor [Aneurinibacillus migulanus]